MAQIKRDRTVEVTYYDWRLVAWSTSETRDRLDATGRGIYRELLDQCYAKGRFPDDPAWICRKCACTSEQLEQAWPLIKGQFVKTRDGYLGCTVANIFRKSFFEFVELQRQRRKGASDKPNETKQKQSDGQPPDKPGTPPRRDRTATKEGKEGKEGKEPEEGNENITPSPLTAEEQKAWLASNDYKGIRLTKGDVWDKIFALRESDLEPSEDRESLYWLNVRLGWFEEFWSGYFRKDDKAAARVAYLLNVKTLELHERIVLAVEAQAPAMLKRTKETRPMASTWINHERWNDQAEGDTLFPGAEYV